MKTYGGIKVQTRACKVCGKRFKFQRSSKKFCSPKCQVASSRKLRPLSQTRTIPLVTQTAPSVSEEICGTQKAEKTLGGRLSSETRVRYCWPGLQEDNCLPGCHCPICTKRYVDKWGFIHRKKIGNRIDE